MPGHQGDNARPPGARFLPWGGKPQPSVKVGAFVSFKLNILKFFLMRYTLWEISISNNITLKPRQTKTHTINLDVLIKYNPPSLKYIAKQARKYGKCTVGERKEGIKTWSFGCWCGHLRTCTFWYLRAWVSTSLLLFMQGLTFCSNVLWKLHLYNT